MNIILIGFMGSGKTTIGQALADQLKLNFLDTDELIEQQQNMTIKDIFNKFGEPCFREFEKKAIESLSGMDNCIVAVGGGAVMFYQNFDHLKQLGTTILLDAPLSKILSNLKGKFRPLVGNTIDEDKMRQLLEYRYPTYQQADIIINTDGLDVCQTINKLLAALADK